MDGLPSSLQENIITAAAFVDHAAGIIRSTVPLAAFGSTILRRVAQVCFEFYDLHHAAPKDHVADLLEKELDGDSADLYDTTLRNMHSLKDNLNVEYVIGQLDKFNRTHSLRVNIIQVVDAVDRDDIDSAEEALRNYHSQRRITSSPVLSFEDAPAILTAARNREIIDLGIEPLFWAGIGPARKEMFLFGAPLKSGKSWFLAHAARSAMFSRHRVLVVTLEMSADYWLLRMVQNVMSAPAMKTEIAQVQVPYARLVTRTEEVEGKTRTYAKFGHKQMVHPRPNLLNAKNWPKMFDTFKRLQNRLRGFRVVERPTGQLTIAGLVSLLDNLEQTEQFIPDVVILDYADLMKINTREYRVSLGELYKNLRGCAIERNFALITATQLNRKALAMFRRGSAAVSEDISKLFTADNYMTYSQTAMEQEWGVARLNASATRHGAVHREIVISQCYMAGQFLMEGYLADKNYQRDYLRALEQQLGENRRRPGLEDDDQEEEDEGEEE